jgi:type II restriction enzyme
MNSLTKEEQKKLREIRRAYYMPPITQRIDACVAQYGIELNAGWIKVLDQLHDILRNSQADIEKLLDQRIKKKEITDKAQSRKSIAGNAFSNSLIYIFPQVLNPATKLYIFRRGTT